MTLVAVERPRTAPYGVLIIIVSLLITHVILLIGSHSVLRSQGLYSSVDVVVALAAIATILNMPMRTPGFSYDEVAPVSAPPTSRLRSPEDRLSLFQFMTVSWMNPLISLGKGKKLEDEDVWRLSFEFQHQTLHDNFRELKGTVVRRLLAANGLDLIITTFLGVTESVASVKSPFRQTSWTNDFQTMRAPYYFNNCSKPWKILCRPEPMP